jgi:arabinofuranan 3-O-arabinosyltransferase
VVLARVAERPVSLLSILTRRRVMWLLIAICIVGVMLNQPGMYIADARFEYAFQPGRGIRQLGALWQPTGGLGRIAGAEHGPIPVFTFWLLRSIGLSPALAQHLWHGLLLAVAALGAAHVMAHFRPRWGIAHLAAGLAYVFNPLSLGLFTNSILFLGSVVVAPWMQLAVLRAGRRDGWRWPALLALALLASLPTELPATLFNLAFLIPTAIYVVWVEKSCSLQRLVGFVVRSGALASLGIGFVAIRTALGRDDLVFRLLVSEPPELVNISTSYGESVRGMGNWLAYFRFGSSVPRPQFAPYIESPWVIAATYALPIAAAIFLARSHWRPRLLFAALAPLSLMVVVGIYSSPLTPWGHLVTWMYDNVPSTSAFRNTLKAGAPMILGFAILAGSLVARSISRRPRPGRVVFGIGWVMVLLVASNPVWTAHIYPPDRRLDEVPAYWYEAADWLNGQAREQTGRTLILPGSSATSYRWGYVGDDIFTALLSVPYLRQSSFPQSTIEGFSVLKALDRAVADPEQSVDSQLDVLRRFGVRYVVLRNDLDWQTSQRPRPARFDRWRTDPELRLVATFGSLGQFTTAPDDSTPDADSERLLPPVEVYEIQDWQPMVRIAPPDAPLLVSGDGEGWLSLATEGYLEGARPIVHTAPATNEQLTADLENGSPLIVTDSNVLRELAATSATIAESSALQPGTTGRGVVSVFPGESAQTTSWIDGARSVTSSISSVARPWFRAENAFDSDPLTSWRTGNIGQAVGSWVQIDFDEQLRIGQIEIADEPIGSRIVSGEVVLSDGTRLPFSMQDGTTVVEIGDRETTSVRVLVRSTSGIGAIGIADIRIDDRDLAERRQVPNDVIEAAGDDPALATALDSAEIGYVFRREIGTGVLPVELALRRRFEVGPPLTATVSGVVRRNDPTSTAEPSSRCRSSSIRIDGAKIRIRLARSETDPRTLTFTSCRAVELAPGWHDLTHGTNLVVDSVSILSDGISPETLEVEWPARPSASSVRMSGVDVAPAQPEPGAAVISGHGAHRGWRADIDGQRLEPITLDAQSAFVMPEVAAGDEAHITFGPQRSYDLAIAAMYASMALYAFLLVRRGSRRSDEPGA